MTLNPGRRTGVSQLTDAELTILDIAATSIARGERFRDSIFRGQWNCPSHGLDDETLGKTLDEFEKAGIIRGETICNVHGLPDRTVELTEVGGALWESERLPDWRRYITDVYPENRISIYGYSSEICEQYFRVACDSRFFHYHAGRIRRAVAKRRLIYWRPVQPVYLLCAQVTDVLQTRCVDWEHFESHRCWWRFAGEISTFWPMDEDA